MEMEKTISLKFYGLPDSTVERPIQRSIEVFGLTFHIHEWLKPNQSGGVERVDSKLRWRASEESTGFGVPGSEAETIALCELRLKKVIDRHGKTKTQEVVKSILRK